MVACPVPRSEGRYLGNCTPDGVELQVMVCECLQDLDREMKVTALGVLYQKARFIGTEISRGVDVGGRVDRQTVVRWSDSHE